MTQPSFRAEEAGEWLKVASADLRLATLALEADPPIVGLALYHAQQAAEKSLKGLLVYHGARYPLTHNLTELLRAVLPFDKTIEAAVRPVLDLTAFATLYRYPGESDEPPLGEARSWVEKAHSVVDVVRGRVSIPPEGTRERP